MAGNLIVVVIDQEFLPYHPLFGAIQTGEGLAFWAPGNPIEVDFFTTLTALEFPVNLATRGKGVDIIGSRIHGIILHDSSIFRAIETWYVF